MNDPISTLLRASIHQFIGRLGRNPEIRYLDNSSVTNVSIAINRLGAGRDAEADWIKLEIWGEAGQAFADQAQKGDLVTVVGRVKTDRWTDKQTGEEKMQLCCRVEQWRVVEQNPQEAARPAAAPAGGGSDPFGGGAPAASAHAPAHAPAYAHAPAPSLQRAVAANTPTHQLDEPPF
jgi:single-strand DNA-binding protein